MFSLTKYSLELIWFLLKPAYTNTQFVSVSSKLQIILTNPNSSISWLRVNQINWRPITKQISSYRYATEHRCGVVVKGPNLSGNISGTDPLKDNRLLLKAEALDDSDEAKLTARVVNELSKEMSRILISHPLNAQRMAQGKNVANVVLLRGCGIRIEVCFLGASICLNSHLEYIMILERR